MKKTLKVLFLLMSLGLIVGCAGRGNPSSNINPSSDSGSSEPSSTEPAEVPVVELSATTASVKVGEYVEVTANLSIPNENATFTATADKEYASTQVTGNTIKVTLSDAAVVDETVTIIVASEGATSATLTITVLSNETYYTIFFFQRYIGETSVATLKTQFNTLLNDFDHVVYEVFTDGGATVKTAAQAVATYNDAHPNYKVNALLGFNGDSDNTLSGAGYKQYSEQNYTYGTDQSRKLWVEKEPEYATTDDSVQQYLFANYGPTKVQLSRKRAEAKVGQTITIPASLDVPAIGAELTFTAESNKEYAAVTVEGNQVSVALSASAVVGEVAIITVSCGTYTPASVAVTVLAHDAVVGNDLVVAFYNKYVTAEKREEIETKFNKYLTDNSISLGSVTFVGFGNNSTNVAAFAGLVMDYNDDFSNPHMVNVLLGTRGDSNDALANAGYKRFETEYNFQKSGESNRKIWATSEYDEANPMPAVKALIDFMDATYKVEPAS